MSAIPDGWNIKTFVKKKGISFDRNTISSKIGFLLLFKKIFPSF